MTLDEVLKIVINAPFYDGVTIRPHEDGTYSVEIETSQPIDLAYWNESHGLTYSYEYGAETEDIGLRAPFEIYNSLDLPETIAALKSGEFYATFGYVDVVTGEDDPEYRYWTLVAQRFPL